MTICVGILKAMQGYVRKRNTSITADLFGIQSSFVKPLIQR